jgi:ArsR family transcriptional regulator
MDSFDLKIIPDDRADEAPHPRDILDDRAAAGLAETFQALADPTRVRIISALLDDELRVYDLAGLVGMTQSAVSHQLRLLRGLGLVKFRKEGRNVIYSLDDDHIRDLFQRGLEHYNHRNPREGNLR